MGASATVLGLLVSSAFVVLPVIGRPPVVRPAPILLFALIVIAAVSGPWRWTEAEWSAVANWNPSRRVIHAGALVVGLLSFVNLFGFEKSLLAIVLGIKALGRTPPPALDARRSWATSGVVLGAVQMSLVVTIVLLNLDRIPKIIAAFRALSDGL